MPFWPLFIFERDLLGWLKFTATALVQKYAKEGKSIFFITTVFKNKTKVQKGDKNTKNTMKCIKEHTS